MHDHLLPTLAHQSTHQKYLISELKSILNEKISQRGLANTNSDLNDLLRSAYACLPTRILICVEKSLQNLLKDGLSRTEFDYIQDDLILQFSDLGGDVLTSELWGGLFYVFTRVGCFKFALVLRRRFIESYMSDLRASGGSVGFVDQLNLGQLDPARHLHLDGFQKVNWRGELVKYKVFVHTLISRGSAKTFPALICAELRFRNLIRGKRVAVIGPAAGFQETAVDDIRGYDLIFIIGFQGYERLPDWIRSNGNVIGSYYGNGAAAIVGNMPFIDKNRPCLEFANYKTMDGLSRCAGVARNSRLFYRNKFISGSPMMAQNAIYDIIMQKPSELKVFNVDLYLNKVGYFNGYFPESAEQIRKTALRSGHFVSTDGFAHHDVFSNFVFTKNLFNLGLFCADKRLTKILDLDVDEYAMALENILIN